MAESLKFTEDHLWVRVMGKRAQVGLSEYAQDELGEVIAVELPDVGKLKVPAPFGPDTFDQAPVPADGVLPPNVADINVPHLFCVAPTVAVVGVA